MLTFIFLLLVVLVRGEDEQNEQAEAQPLKSVNREKRFTCDVLSGWGWNHTPCTLHCRLIGRDRGYCNSQGVCVCISNGK